jgi:hypothetical protein
LLTTCFIRSRCAAEEKRRVSDSFPAPSPKDVNRL